MPVYRSHSVFSVRGIKAFLRLDAGLVRGEVPDQDRQTEAQKRALRRARERIESQSWEPGRMRKQLAGRTGDGSRELSYEELYEARIRATSADTAIGAGRLPFDTVGRMELEILKREGLRPTDTLVDLGCGTGRLAVHAIPALAGGRYVGIDISRTMLDEAQKRVEKTIPDPPSRVSWVHQTTPEFALDIGAVDMICAFSVINHMEHEDAYLYLKEALRVVRPGGRFVFSCLPLNTERAREVFLKSASVDMQTRHRQVRHVVTSKELMDEVARLAGWTPVRWHDGDEKSIRLVGEEEPRKFSQSVCVLEAPHENGADRPG
jgi:ubiquinone/menaquinone biosynthesis C-methylase UbiE